MDPSTPTKQKIPAKIEEWIYVEMGPLLFLEYKDPLIFGPNRTRRIQSTTWTPLLDTIKAPNGHMPLTIHFRENVKSGKAEGQFRQFGLVQPPRPLRPSAFKRRRQAP